MGPETTEGEAVPTITPAPRRPTTIQLLNPIPIPVARDPAEGPTTPNAASDAAREEINRPTSGRTATTTSAPTPTRGEDPAYAHVGIDADTPRDTASAVENPEGPEIPATARLAVRNETGGVVETCRPRTTPEPPDPVPSPVTTAPPLSAHSETPVATPEATLTHEGPVRPNGMPAAEIEAVRSGAVQVTHHCTIGGFSTRHPTVSEDETYHRRREPR